MRGCCISICAICAFSFRLSAIPPDSLTIERTVKKSIYPEAAQPKSSLYNWAWGKHYRDLYIKPIRVPVLTDGHFRGGVKVFADAWQFNGLVLEDTLHRLYLLRPLGGSTSFINSSFFQDMYSKEDFENTYMDDFIGDAYTMINPYTFMASDYMAKELGLNSSSPKIYYIPEEDTTYTVADGHPIQDRLASLSEIPDRNIKDNVYTTAELLAAMQRDKSYVVDQRLYIRERLFDMLIGDWNKTPDNWMWEAVRQNDSIVYHPKVIDRNHAFTKVDGFFFKQMLDVLQLGFIKNYRRKFTQLKKFNSLGFALDMAITAESDERLWMEEARWLKEHFTDDLIDTAFGKLPKGIECAETDRIQLLLKARRNGVEALARNYYHILQKNPIITGTTKDDVFVIDRTHPDSAHIQIYNPANNAVVFDKKYDKERAREMWIYGLDGDDHYVVTRNNGWPMEVLLITGKGRNSYDLRTRLGLKVYAYPSGEAALDSVRFRKKVRTVISDNEKVIAYDYNKTKYSNVSLSPWGFYDSDLGLNLGTFVTYTLYGYKRMPFTYQHRFGFNYLSGFMYHGVFPLYREGRDITLDATFGFPKNYFNFFGFGNNTGGYKDEGKNYNRVNLRTFKIKPAYNFRIDDRQELSFYSSIELVKVRQQSAEKLIYEFYPEDHRIFKTNYIADLGATYQFDVNNISFLSKLEGEVSAGWKTNLREAHRNLPYSEASLQMTVQLTDRFSWATKAKGKALFTDDYEFYQAATTELRGFRNNRFLGQYSFYQYSDFRLDMGELKNAYTPIKYGFFGGVDYGRVWYPEENSPKWHASFGGGLWITLLNKITTKYSLFGSKDSTRFMFELGMGF